jgi:hypothetical protein
MEVVLWMDFVSRVYSTVRGPTLMITIPKSIDDYFYIAKCPRSRRPGTS